MKKILGSAAAAAILMSATPANAQTTLASQAVVATATIGTHARLNLTGGPILFGDFAPDTMPTITAAPVTVDARARVMPATQLNVTVEASDTYFDPGTDSIPVSNLSWTVSGAPFAAGTMSTAAQNVATWTGPANQSGTQTYSLVNLWTYVPGVHSVTLTYTLSTP